jgi:hypothetical protein
LLTNFGFSAEVSSEEEDDPGLDGTDMDEILLSPASQIRPEDSASPGNSRIAPVNWILPAIDNLEINLQRNNTPIQRIRGKTFAGKIRNSIYCCWNFFLKTGTATEPNLHCKKPI